MSSKGKYLALLFLLLLGIGFTQERTNSIEKITVDVNANATPFPHFWDQMFGSGRAILSLRESYRNDLRAVKSVTDFKYVRFHAILHDEVGVYGEDDHGNPVYNFSYVDEIYDGLLKNGVRPFVEISFMPKKLAFNPDALHPFWYKQNVSPPKSFEKWDALMVNFARHLVERYGIEEVSQWYFEVWNEPNIDFWTGVPAQKSYFDFYAHTARALKQVSPKIRVGGPATAAASWVPEFLQYTQEQHVPVDFVSTHGYADDTVENLFGTKEDIPMKNRVCRAVEKVRKQIDGSATPGLPLLWTEWNVPGAMQARDTIYVGPALANTIRECDGMTTMMSFWTFSDVFEEGGPYPEPFVGGFGLRAKGGINKPSYYAFSLLHRLGDERIKNESENVIVTRRKDGKVVLAAWNAVELNEKGKTLHLRINFKGLTGAKAAEVSLVDEHHGNPLPTYKAMDSPTYPKPDQIEKLNEASHLSPPKVIQLTGDTLELSLEPNALALIEIANAEKH